MEEKQVRLRAYELALSALSKTIASPAEVLAEAEKIYSWLTGKN